MNKYSPFCYGVFVYLLPLYNSPFHLGGEGDIVLDPFQNHPQNSCCFCSLTDFCRVLSDSITVYLVLFSALSGLEVFDCLAYLQHVLEHFSPFTYELMLKSLNVKSIHDFSRSKARQ